MNRAVSTALLGLGWAIGHPIAYSTAAELTLEGKRVNPLGATAAPNVNCNRGEGAVNCGLGSGRDPDTTPFLQELVTGPDNHAYYHVILGDPAKPGFAQEVYILAGGATWQGGVGTVSAGKAFSTTYQQALAAGSISGNGSANPTKVVMRQTNQDKQLTQDFVKDVMSNKPEIALSINDGEMRLKFGADMRALSLSDKYTAAGIVNQIGFVGSDALNFDQATDAQYAHVNAGQYSWTPGKGPGQSMGTWSYLNGGAVNPVLLADWVFYRHAGENPSGK